MIGSSSGSDFRFRPKRSVGRLFGILRSDFMCLLIYRLLEEFYWLADLL